MRIQIIIALFTICSCFSAAAQTSTTNKIEGIVQDENGKPVPSATVSLMKASDSSLVKMAVSEKDGQYEFESISQGMYFISATSVGFTKVASAPFELTNAAVKVPGIKLLANSGNMTGVVVQAKRPLIENKIDKMVVNVDASPTNAGATALEVLEKSPGIYVDRDGNISLKGKQGVIVLMDGKQTYLSGADLANLLRNMPASQLDQIEIMTQPSAKFDASGTAGVLNLKTKRSMQRGLSGSFSLSYVQGRYPKSPNSFNFNYRSGKFNFFSNISYSYWSGFNDQTLKRNFKDESAAIESVFDQKADQKNTNHGYNARLGLDYSIDPKTTIGFLVKGIYNKGTWQNDGRANIYKYGVFDSFNIAKTVNNDTWKNLGANVNFRRVLSSAGNEITADLDYLRYDTRTQQTSDNANYYPNNSPTRDPFWLRGNLPAGISIYSGKVDYVQNLPNSAKMEAGVKSSYVSTDNDAQYTYFNHTEDKWMTDETRSNRFLYKENINAAYVNYSIQLKKWGLQTGLRAENTISKGHQFGNKVSDESKFSKNYTQLFPTAYVSYALNDNNQFGLSYGRRIERPNYQDMNPFQYFLDQYTYRQGNPNLTPQFTHNIELSHNFRRVLNTTINYTATTDILNDVLKQNDETKVTYQTKENVASRRTLGIAISYSTPVTKWWSSTVYVTADRSHYKGVINERSLDESLFAFMANSSQQFRFAKTWSAEVSGFYRSRALETGMFLIEPMGVISFGFGKQILKNKGSLKLSITDPFYIQKAKVFIDFGNIDAVVLNKWDNRRIGLTFTYRFSKGEGAQAQRKRASSAQEEQNRVGGAQQ
jgi:outer membrane receptor protein involved in Fe transport